MSKKSSSKWESKYELAQRLLLVEGGNVERPAKEALALAEAEADDERIALSLSILSAFYIATNRPESEEISRRAVDMAERVFGTMSQEYCDQILTRAIWLDLTGDHGQALALRETAISLAEAFNNVEGVLEILDSLVFYFITMAQYNQAESYFERAAGLRRKLYGADSFECQLHVPTQLAILRGQGDHERVEKIVSKLGPEARKLDAIFSTLFVPLQQAARSLVKPGADQLSVDQMGADQLSVDQLSVDQLSVDQLSADQLSADQMNAALPVVRIPAGKVRSH